MMRINLIDNPYCPHNTINRCWECEELLALKDVEQAIRNALPYHQDGSEGIRRYKLVEDSLKVLDALRNIHEKYRILSIK